MDDLIAFLQARLDEDEQAAQQVLSFEADGFTWEYQWARHGRYQGRVTRSSFEPGAPSPRRVLAEVEAKRRILDHHQPATDGGGRTSCSSCGELHCCSEPWPCPTVRLLALPYADHPDYRPEWQV